jgi:phage shock protein PspC (stress-responsive transcriptional regulator)
MNTPADTTETSQPETEQPQIDQPETEQPQFDQPRGLGSRQLCRPLHDRMLGGVAAGIADYLDVDATIVRIVFAVLTFIGGAGVPVYLAGWLLIPEEGSDRSLAADIVDSLSRSLSARSR